MEQSHHIIPTLAEITRRTEEISPATTVQGVIEIFRKDPSLLGLPVTEEGRFIGVINRKALFSRHLGRPFALDLYGKKPIRILLDEQHFAMEPDLDINSSLAKLLEVDPELETDSFPVVAGDHYVGIVPVSTLMMKISETQAILFEALDKLDARLREEVFKARKIQQDLLPRAECRFDDITISAEVVTSSEVGGDFYDYFQMGNGRLGLVVADVSGHGVQSGMVTTAAKASLHTLIDQGIATPAELLNGMNNAILATARQTLLMTCLIVVIDLRSGRFTLANAGHNFPYLYRGKNMVVEMVEDVAGFPLGFEKDCSYTEFNAELAAGDSLFLYTDGIVECRNQKGEDFGYSRLEAILCGHLGRHPTAAKKHLLETAARFTGAKSFEDDVTLLIAAFHP
jgi:serine phosphatase RsbU (regulator of sigma subunit)/CBS domain-containing protein